MLLAVIGRYWFLRRQRTIREAIVAMRLEDILAMSEVTFKSEFRFTQVEFAAIHSAMAFPEYFYTSERDRISSKLGFLMLLMFLGGARVRSIQARMGCSYGRVSRVVQHVSQWIHDKWAHLLDFQGSEQPGRLLSPERLDFYSKVNKRNGNPLPGCWGFLDGTLRPIARPVRAQQNAYNGWKHFHALKYQFLSTPDGLVWVTPPEDGAVHDVYALRESGLLPWLEQNSHGPGGEYLTLYADSGYSYYNHVSRPWGILQSTPERRAWNLKMSGYRISVEWCIGSVSTLFPRLNNRQSQKTLLSAISRDFHVACLLRNALSCVSGNQTSQFFSVNAPNLCKYFKI